MKKIFAIVGHPVSHSLSPKLHNAVFKELGLNDYEYVFCDTAPKDLAAVMQALKEGKYAGFSVTIPHKQAVMQYIDRFSPAAQRVGAVNTMLRVSRAEFSIFNYPFSIPEDKEAVIYGDNTDYSGFQKALLEAGVIHEEDENGDWGVNRDRALILGSGGVAKAVAAALFYVGFSVHVASRSPDAVGNRFQHFAAPVFGYSELDPDWDWKLIVNCTPVGMKGQNSTFQKGGSDALLTDPKWFRKDCVYADVIYTPRMTPFLQKATDAGAKVVTGDRMFLWQAVEQAKLFTGREEVSAFDSEVFRIMSTILK